MFTKLKNVITEYELMFNVIGGMIIGSSIGNLLFTIHESCHRF